MYLNCVYFGAQAIQPTDKVPEDDRAKHEMPSTDEFRLAPDAFDISLEEHEAQWQKETYENDNYSIYHDEQFRALVELYLLADRLQDVKTANIVIDEIVRLAGEAMANPGPHVVRLVYETTIHGNPLRKWIRDTQVYDTSSDRHALLHVGEYPADFKRDVAVELMRIRDCDGYASQLLWRREHSELVDKCRYHLHDKEHPRCVPEESD